MDLLLLSFQSLIVFISICVYFNAYTTRLNKSAVYGFKIYPFLGSLPEFLKNRHRFLDWTTEILRDCPTNTAVYFRPGNIHGIITANPANVEHMLKTNFDNYPKGEKFISLLHDFLGGGIFNADGDLWKVQRKTASYAFSAKSLRNFVMDNVSFEIKSRLVPLMGRAAEKGERLDLQDVLERFAFDNICKMAFNVDPACLGGDGKYSAVEFMQAFDDATNISSGRFLYAFQSFLHFKKFFSVGSEKKLRDSISTAHSFADHVIMSRMENPNEQHDDLLSRFIGNDENNSPEFLRDIIISIILAGRDTTSSALSWFFWLVSTRPEIQRNILNELNTIRAGNNTIGDVYEFNDLKDMNYLQAAITEAMRLYPPVPVDTKESLDDDVMPDGTVVRKGWLVTYHAYAMGRMESIWGEDCGEYKPERWIGEDGTCQQESAFKYPVFHGGARMCLGKELAYIQMKCVAAAVIEGFEIAVAEEEEGKCPEHLLSMTLRIKGGLPSECEKEGMHYLREGSCTFLLHVFLFDLD